MPQQKLLSLTSGRVFYDDSGELTKLREQLAYYPRDIWLYLLASGWQVLSEEMPFVGRTGDLSDDLGSHLIASRQVQSVMDLVFLMERRYAPFSKWFGTAFARLEAGTPYIPVFTKILQADDWKEREHHLAQAYQLLIQQWNGLRLVDPVSDEVKPFFDRPYLVTEVPSSEAIQALITDPQIKALPLGVGAINQITSSVHVLNDPRLCKRLEHLYD